MLHESEPVGGQQRMKHTGEGDRRRKFLACLQYGYGKPCQAAATLVFSARVEDIAKLRWKDSALHLRK